MSDQQVTGSENPCITSASDWHPEVSADARLIAKYVSSMDEGVGALVNGQRALIEAVRALKPAPAPTIPSELMHLVPIGPGTINPPIFNTALDSAEAHIELQKSVVERGYQKGDGALMASLYAANKRQLADIDALRTEVNRQLAENVRLRADLRGERQQLATMRGSEMGRTKERGDARAELHACHLELDRLRAENAELRKGGAIPPPETTSLLRELGRYRAREAGLRILLDDLSALGESHGWPERAYGIPEKIAAVRDFKVIDHG